MAAVACALVIVAVGRCCHRAVALAAVVVAAIVAVAVAAELLRYRRCYSCYCRLLV